jgi:hypothetical protein
MRSEPSDTDSPPSGAAETVAAATHWSPIRSDSSLSVSRSWLPGSHTVLVWFEMRVRSDSP